MKFIYFPLVLTVFAVIARCDEVDSDTPSEPVKYMVTHEVFFDIEIKANKNSETLKSGRVVIGLFGDICPMTVTNFVQLAKGFKRDNVSIYDSHMCNNLNNFIYIFLLAEKVLVQG